MRAEVDRDRCGLQMFKSLACHSAGIAASIPTKSNSPYLRLNSTLTLVLRPQKAHRHLLSPPGLPFLRPCYRIRYVGHSTRPFPALSIDPILSSFREGQRGCSKLSIVGRTVSCDLSELSSTKVGPCGILTDPRVDETATSLVCLWIKGWGFPHITLDPSRKP